MFAKGAFTVVLASALLAQAPSRTIWDGVYSDAQAQRGKTVYETNCAGCHKADLTGIEDALKGDRFFDKHREDNLDELFNTLKTMPLRKPGSLANQEYLDVLTYVLQSNEIPSGSAELRAEALSQVRVIRKDGPGQVPGSSPVSAVGCVQAAPNDSWLLVNATEPIRNRGLFDRVPSELDAARAAALGNQTFKLQDAEYLPKKPQAGQRALAKGTLVRAPAGNRIIVTFLESVGNCS
jgi:mono/diheme cytochrome c family protein